MFKIYSGIRSVEFEGKTDDELLDEIRLHTPIAEK